jgi:hypothetical protein
VGGHDEAQIAELLSALPPAPKAWVRAAQELPHARRELDGLVRRARENAEFRRLLLADLEGALLGEGVEPRPVLVRALRRRLDTA